MVLLLASHIQYFKLGRLKTKNDTNKYKATKRIEEVNKDDRIKKYTNKSSRDNNRKDASLHGFHRNSIT